MKTIKSPIPAALRLCACLILLLIPALSSAQTDWQLCRQCCYAQPDEDLARVLAPILARQCPDCALLSAAQCTDVEDSAGGMMTMLVRYKIALPDGTRAVHCAKLSRSQWANAWSGFLYPLNHSLKPACGG
jgi:hypothetical protein